MTNRVEYASQTLADFASSLKLDSVPESIAKRAKLSILDALGTALLSSTLEKSGQIGKAVRGLSDRGRSTTLGLGFKAPLLEGALINGMLVEGLDYSDIHVGAGLHPTSVILPAVLTLGEAKGASGGELLLSHIVGCEAMIRLGLTAPGRFHARGIQPTSAVGVLAAALASAKMMGLQARVIEEAISLATTLVFGSSLSVRVGAYFGGVDSGRAAESGVLSAMLAREGVTGIARDSLEGRFGFFETYVGSGNYDLRPISKGLGRNWEVEKIFLKRYPTSFACTQMLDAAIRLKTHAELSPAEIDQVRFGENAFNIGLFSEPEEKKRRPADIYDAKTSHYFLLALALSYGAVTPELLQSRLKDPAILDLSDRVSYELDAQSRWVEVNTKNDRALRETQDTLVPTSEVAVRRKFLENASIVVGGERAKKIESIVDSLEHLASVKELTALMVGRSRL